MANLRVIDVSEHQGTINWDAVKGHIDGAILRCGYGDNIASQDDKQWKRNADECTRLGIPFGVYIYSYATSDAQARSEAEHVLRLISGYKLSYPIYLDLEQAGTETGAIQRANIFGDIIENAGYWCGVYANTNWWTNYLVGLERFVKWVAQYNSVCTYQGTYDIWQYTSGGSVPGISGNVDMNHCYRDYPAEITGGDTKPTPPAVAPSGSTLDLVVGVMQENMETETQERQRLEVGTARCRTRLMVPPEAVQSIIQYSREIRFPELLLNTVQRISILQA